MGYAVYEDIWHFGRWAGYAVPAECDFPGCTEMIDRGMGYQCEEHWTILEVIEGDEVVDEVDFKQEGCYLYFCGEHLTSVQEHDTIEPKPDHPQWLWWILSAPSWGQWREDNPKKVEQYLDTVRASGWRPSMNDFENLFVEMEDR